MPPALKICLNPPRHPPRSPMKNNRPKIRRRALKPETKNGRTRLQPNSSRSRRAGRYANGRGYFRGKSRLLGRGRRTGRERSRIRSGRSQRGGERRPEKRIRRLYGQNERGTPVGIRNVALDPAGTDHTQRRGGDQGSILTKYTGARRNSCAGSSSSRAA